MDRPAPRPSRPILLVGLPGAGKSTIAPLLAARLGLAAHDSDALIEAALGRSIADIFREHGETRFRDEERRMLGELLAGPAAVIAAGGGAWLDAETRASVLGTAATIWLDADLDTLAARLDDGRDRPLLAGDVRGRLAALKVARDPLYALAAIRIDAGQAPERVVAAILAALAEPVR
ncbi:shikimate kinase [Sphingosinicella sp.]|uniref:shikimate kinase n=1 Tax=Sphingosinicella sp. TaxID=1917971 RepID=UPI004037B251